MTDKIAPQDEDEAKLQEQGALRIQAIQRGKQDRKKVEEKKAAIQEARMQEASAKKIQAIQRGKQDRKKVEQKKVQKQMSDKLAPQDEDEAKLQEQGALRIQAIQRGKQDRKKVEEKKAAIKEARMQEASAKK